MFFWFFIASVFSLTMISGYLYFVFVLLYFALIFFYLQAQAKIERIKDKIIKWAQLQRNLFLLVKWRIQNNKGGFYGRK